MWDLPGPGLEPVSPALAGGFLTTAPPGKPSDIFYYLVNAHQDNWFHDSLMGRDPLFKKALHWEFPGGPVVRILHFQCWGPRSREARHEWMHGWMDGWMDGWMVGWVVRQASQPRIKGRQCNDPFTKLHWNLLSMCMIESFFFFQKTFSLQRGVMLPWVFHASKCNIPEH